MDQGWAALGGAVVGGLLTGLVTWGVELWRDRKQARNLSIAVAGELGAVAELVRRRGWLNGLAGLRDAAAVGKVIRYSVHLPPSFLLVSRSAMSHAGLLPGQLARLVPRVVMYGDGVASDLNRLATYAIDHPDGALESDNPQGAYVWYSELHDVLASALEVCDEIVGEVAALYPPAKF